MDTKTYTISKLGEYNYSLDCKGEYKSQLYSSILRSNILTSTLHDRRKNIIYFTADIVQTLPEYIKSRPNGRMSEKECAKLIYNLTTQIQCLEENNYILYGYDLNDIVVINESTFIDASSEYILPLDLETNMITFYSPNMKPFFSNPELIKLTKLPSSIHFKSSYYSLGVLVAFCILNKNLLQNGVISDNELETIIEPIRHTKVYWFIKRCLNKRYEQRVMLFV